ncbi:tetratricopeptide repeat protein [Marinomonas balearica]|uniref:Cytochrome c-type biogenesis protein CcmH n=1 Tax=Marinomonas balearica TaxID=491947 RepID=A0A4R6M9Y2_9GAMM|nr:hypothetical protein [Marinomonas balearica]TDO98328.1 cytochrome c-type biogenesis protein CcmH [Marinomonas balearica]
MILTGSIIVLLLVSVFTLIEFSKRSVVRANFLDNFDQVENNATQHVATLRVGTLRIGRTTVVAFSIMFTILASTVLYKKLGYQADVSFVEALQTGELDTNQSTEYLIYRTKRYNHYSDWFYLAEHYFATAQYGLAISTYRTALERSPTDGDVKDRVQILNGYAQAAYMFSERQITNDLVDIVEQILILDPKNSSALGFTGIIAYEAGEIFTAFSKWAYALRFSSLGQERLTLLKTINQAQKVTQANKMPHDDSSVQMLDTTHIVYLNLAIPEDVALTQDTVFLVYAKVDELPYPISIQKVPLHDAQGTIILTNMDYMIEGKTLADFSNVDIFVRMSTKHDQKASSGRIVGELLNISTQAQKKFRVNVVL